MSTINPAAQAAQAAARRANGEFGSQQHSAPDAALDTLPTHDENGYYIDRYPDGGEVQLGDRVRYRQAAGGALPRQDGWTVGTVIPDPRGEDPSQREKMESVGMNPDEITLLGDDGRHYHLSGHEIEPYSGATPAQSKAYADTMAWHPAGMAKEAGEAATEIVQLADERPDASVDELNDELLARQAEQNGMPTSHQWHRRQRAAIAEVLDEDLPYYRPEKLEDAQPGDLFIIKAETEGGTDTLGQIDRVTKTAAVMGSTRWSLKTGKPIGKPSQNGWRLSPVSKEEVEEEGELPLLRRRQRD